MLETKVEILYQVSLVTLHYFQQENAIRVEEQKLETLGSFSSRVSQETNSFLF